MLLNISDTTFLSNILSSYLIGLASQFYGPVFFTNTTSAHYKLITRYASLLIHNYVGIIHNHIKGFSDRAYIKLMENTHMDIKNNNITNYFADLKILIARRMPMPCFFQYYSNHGALERCNSIVC